MPNLLHARTILQDAAYWGPTDINPLTFYTLAMQKTQALNQQQLFLKSHRHCPAATGGRTLGGGRQLRSRSQYP